MVAEPALTYEYIKCHLESFYCHFIFLLVLEQNFLPINLSFYLIMSLLVRSY